MLQLLLSELPCKIVKIWSLLKVRNSIKAFKKHYHSCLNTLLLKGRSFSLGISMGKGAWMLACFWGKQLEEGPGKGCGFPIYLATLWEWSLAELAALKAGDPKGTLLRKYWHLQGSHKVLARTLHLLMLGGPNAAGFLADAIGKANMASQRWMRFRAVLWIKESQHPTKAAMTADRKGEISQVESSEGASQNCISKMLTRCIKNWQNTDHGMSCHSSY
jgi:hypothetical protein